MKTEKTTSVKRIFDILGICVQNPQGIAFNELRRRCGNLPASTLSRLLTALSDCGMLCKDSVNGNYRTGNDLLNLAKLVLGAQSRHDLLQPVVDALAIDTSESAVYFELDGNQMVLLAKSEQHDSYHYMPLYGLWGSLSNDPFGMVCIPYLPHQKMEKGITKFLLEVKAEGCLALDRQIRSRVLRIAAPVFSGKNGPVTGSIGITMHWRELPNENIEILKQRVKQAAQQATVLISPCSKRCSNVK